MNPNEYEYRREATTIIEAERSFSEIRNRGQFPDQAFTLVNIFIVAISEQRSKICSIDAPAFPYHGKLIMLFDETIAFITFRVLFLYLLNKDGVKDGYEDPRFSTLAISIGKNCFWEWKHRRSLVTQLDFNLENAGLPDIKRCLEKRQARSRPKRVEDQLMERNSPHWTEKECGALGGYVLDLAEKSGIITIKKPRIGKRTIGRVRMCEELITLLDYIYKSEDKHLKRLITSIARPMIVKPQQWTGLHYGGFLSDHGNPETTDLIKHRNQPQCVKAFEDASTSGRLNQVCEAINALQETPWQINQKIHRLLVFAWQEKISLPGLPTLHELQELTDKLTSLKQEAEEHSVENEPRRLARRNYYRIVSKIRKLPSPRNQDILKDLQSQRHQLKLNWQKLEDEDNPYRAAWRMYFSTLSKRNRMLSRINEIQSLLEACKELEECRTQIESTRLRLYIPFQVDRQGRAYAMVTTLNPQGNDPQKALLEFADGKPLETDGIIWLARHLANTYGLNKISLSERIKWVKNHQSVIERLANLVPDDGVPVINLSVEDKEFWAEADDPWCFLAACFEWANQATPGFVSRLPIALDGSANGLQHLSALVRDSEGARISNLIHAEEPQDIYQRIADELKKKVDATIHLRGEELATLLTTIPPTRKMVKPPVMTLFYGATTFGIQKLIRNYIRDQDTQAIYSSETVRKAAELLSILLVQSVDSLTGRKMVMELLGDIADTLGKKYNQVMCWTAPSGLPIVAEYYRRKTEDCYWMHPVITDKRRSLKLSLPVTRKEGEVSVPVIDAAKQKRTVTPNFIHSLDAAHMMITITRLHELGIKHFAVIHDSFGTHACDTSLMAQILRESFVFMYREDILQTFMDNVKKNVEEIDAKNMACPEYGDFEIEEVYSATYMFS